MVLNYFAKSFQMLDLDLNKVLDLGKSWSHEELQNNLRIEEKGTYQSKKPSVYRHLLKPSSKTSKARYIFQMIYAKEATPSRIIKLSVRQSLSNTSLSCIKES